MERRLYCRRLVILYVGKVERERGRSKAVMYTVTRRIVTYPAEENRRATSHPSEVNLAGDSVCRQTGENGTVTYESTTDIQLTIQQDQYQHDSQILPSTVSYQYQ